MDKTKGANPTAGDADTDAQTVARQQEATSSDTLSDLQETQSDPSTSQTGSSGSSGSSSTPSPDGAPDTTRGGTADGRDTGGPM